MRRCWGYGLLGGGVLLLCGLGGVLWGQGGEALSVVVQAGAADPQPAGVGEVVRVPLQGQVVNPPVRPSSACVVQAAQQLGRPPGYTDNPETVLRQVRVGQCDMTLYKNRCCYQAAWFSCRMAFPCTTRDQLTCPQNAIALGSCGGSISLTKEGRHVKVPLIKIAKQPLS